MNNNEQHNYSTNHLLESSIKLSKIAKIACKFNLLAFIIRTMPNDHPRQKQVNFWLIRLLVITVLAWNLEAAITFMLQPRSYLAGFDLQGIPGQVAVAGTGLLFLMWQVPYVFAVVNPMRFRVSLIEALIMQGIGLLGETIILLRMPAIPADVQNSIFRFIIFDGIGLILLALALILVGRITRTRS